MKTIGDLAAMDRGMLSAELGVQGGVIWDYANGIESSPLVQREVKEKSYGSSITTSEDVESCQAACQLLLGLCETVGTRPASGFHESRHCFRAGYGLQL